MSPAPHDLVRDASDEIIEAINDCSIARDRASIRSYTDSHFALAARDAVDTLTKE